MLVAIFLFVLITMMIVGMMKFVKGANGSAKTTTPTVELRSVMELINQKMANANGGAKLATNSDQYIVGFCVYNNILAIVNNGNCDYVTRIGNNLKMKTTNVNLGATNSCNTNLASLNISNANNYPIDLTGNNIDVTNFVVNCSGTPSVIDLSMTVAERNNPSNNLQIMTKYNLDYFTYKRFQIN